MHQAAFDCELAKGFFATCLVWKNHVKDEKVI